MNTSHLATWVARQRWFAAKDRRIAAIAIDDDVPLPGAHLLLLSVELSDGARQRYAAPVRAVGGELRDGDELVDALGDAGVAHALLELISHGTRLAGRHGEVRGHPTTTSVASTVGPTGELPVRRLGAEQSNTSIAFGELLVLKHFRSLAEGRNPEQEVTGFLTERTTFRNAPRLAGHLEYRRDDGVTLTLAVLLELIPGARDGWVFMLDELRRGFAHAPVDRTPTADEVAATARTSLDALARLGTLTAELHRALASRSDDPAFAPEPITRADVERWAGAVRGQLGDARRALGDGVALREPDLSHGLAGLVGRTKIRHHGDYHLGQTLYRPDSGDFVIIDFEGEPLRPIAERRQKHAALRDVAGMLRSIDYAVVSAMPPGLDAWAGAWHALAVEAFTRAYLTTTARAPFVPETDDRFRRAVAVFELEKAAYEVMYETRHRPDWVRIPAAGLRRACAALSPFDPAPAGPVEAGPAGAGAAGAA
jgi:trehalose synthase-fused probable maltokinase